MMKQAFATKIYLFFWLDTEEDQTGGVQSPTGYIEYIGSFDIASWFVLISGILCV